MYRSARIFVQTSISILDIVYNPLCYQIKDNYNCVLVVKLKRGSQLWVLKKFAHLFFYLLFGQFCPFIETAPYKWRVIDMCYRVDRCALWLRDFMIANTPTLASHMFSAWSRLGQVKLTFLIAVIKTNKTECGVISDPKVTGPSIKNVEFDQNTH